MHRSPNRNPSPNRSRGGSPSLIRLVRVAANQSPNRNRSPSPNQSPSLHRNRRNLIRRNLIRRKCQTHHKNHPTPLTTKNQTKHLAILK